MARVEERDYEANETGDITGKRLRAMRKGEVQGYNRDYDRLVDSALTVRADRMLEDARAVAFELTRHVMERANQNYGGSLAEGNEIGIRLLRPDDLEMGVAVATGTADSWEFTWVATGDQDVFGTAGDVIDLGDQSDAESILIVAWSTNHPSPKTESIQATKFGRDLFVQPFPWDLITDARGAVKTVEANPWFVAFPGEDFTFDVNVFVTGDDVLRAVGVYISIGDNLRTM